MNYQQKRIAIVVQGFEFGGGVPTMAKFLYRTIWSSGQFEPVLISVAMAAKDTVSVRLLSPQSWGQGIKQRQGTWENVPFTHIGAFLSELEFQRYAPRTILTNLLNTFDLVQLVTGAPVLAYATQYVTKPLCINVASTVYQDQKSSVANAKGVKKLYLTLTTHINARLEKAALPYMTHIFCQSYYTKELLSKLVPSEKLSLSIPGVDTNLFRPSDVYCEDSYILAVGRFADPRKNVKLLLQAYKGLRLSYPASPRLALAGLDGLTQNDWKLAEEMGIAMYLDVYQDVTAEKLANLYREASLFVLPSNEEGFGLVIIEAMASGLPVISTDCGGPRTAVIEGKTGFLTPVGDPSSLACKMRLLLEDVELRRQMGRKARTIVEERFSLEAAGNVYLRKYDELLGENV